MDEHVRHRVIWNLLQPLARLWIPFRFRLECEPIREKGPMLLIVNHGTAWDPLFMALAMGRKQIYYVASEHILRAGFAGTCAQVSAMVSSSFFLAASVSLAAISAAREEYRAASMRMESRHMMAAR